MNRILFLIFLLSMGLHGAAQEPEASAPKERPFVLGKIEELPSKELGEVRILNVYLPEGYRANDTARYPVVYLLDGSADEDFIHIAGLYQFNSFPWVDRVPKSIVVGIATVDRRRDFTYPTRNEKDRTRYPTTGKSARFISFLEKELQPFVETHYRCTGTRTLIGQSLGGLLATEVLLTKPELFTHYIIVSPSLWWDNGSLLERKPDLLREGFSHPLEVYVGVGKEGVVPGDIPRVMEVDANLLADKLRASKSRLVHVEFDYLPDEDHGTILHQAVANALRLFKLHSTTNH
ncbi:alpha/beta hydrolase [Flaviaesturariibacter aridisoli]|uniref:Alpha/beta hydrolase n=1 Tax=Flaviaesturariibacter aridisoli TaxID=2545761 RepID=A0A4V2WN45_9BACT|nr:alpha/beta hydrolase-fold protein [Flaviaesturariibacter aridisoli]TCZ74072.1 alpha/beta hydrolase [Flaviaesturariibacter aridisoli]